MDVDALTHPQSGPSWEAFVIESLVNAAPDGTAASFYRTAAGAEIDLLLTLPGGALWAIEAKLGVAPKVEKGFHLACEDLQPVRRFVAYLGNDRYPLNHGVEAIPLVQLCAELAKA